jgi:hypothetical protein
VQLVRLKSLLKEKHHCFALTDGEVESFELVPVHEVAELVRTSNAYKPNCSLVIINFLFRHGYDLVCIDQLLF